MMFEKQPPDLAFAPSSRVQHISASDMFCRHLAHKEARVIDVGSSRGYARHEKRQL
jgi:hypothetical protein